MERFDSSAIGDGYRVSRRPLEHRLIMDSTLESFLSQPVVLDTGGPIVYLGTLSAVTEQGFVLRDADVHDTRDGHATPEVYVNEARRHGISPNRKHLLVMHSAVTSISRLEDVVEE